MQKPSMQGCTPTKITSLKCSETSYNAYYNTCTNWLHIAVQCIYGDHPYISLPIMLSINTFRCDV